MSLMPSRSHCCLTRSVAVRRPQVGLCGQVLAAGVLGLGLLTLSACGGGGGSDAGGGGDAGGGSTNRAPVANVSSLPGQSLTLGEVFHFAIAANLFTDPDADPLTIRAAGLPAGITLMQDSSGYHLHGVPSESGQFSATISAEDPQGLRAQTRLPLNVAGAAGGTPEIHGSIPNQQATVGTVFHYSVPSNLFTDPDGQTLTLSASGVPLGITLMDAAASPHLHGAPTRAGTYTVRLSAQDPDGNSAHVSFELVVAPDPGVNGSANRAPLATGDIPVQVGTVGTPFSYTIAPTLFNDPDGEVPSLSAIDLPPGVVLQVDATSAKLVGNPTAAGSFPVALSATDRFGASTQVLFTIRIVGPANVGLFADAGPDMIVTDLDGSGSEEVWIFNRGAHKNGEMLAGRDGGYWRFLPDGQYAKPVGTAVRQTFKVGVHTGTYHIPNPSGPEATDTMTLTVLSRAENRPPTATISAPVRVVDVNSSGGEPVIFDASGSNDPNQDIVSYVWRSGSSLLSTGMTPTITLPVGTTVVELTVTDSAGQSDSVALSVIVDQGPTTSPSSLTLDERIAAAMTIWRKDDKKFGVGCWACHGPDFLDLAFVNFRAQEDLVHRGLVHVTEDDMIDLLDGIKAMREKLKITPVDRNTFRPFQPGGEILPGDTYIERDNAFALQMKEQPLLWTTGVVRNVGDARIMRDEILGRRPLQSTVPAPEVYVPDAKQELKHWNFRRMKVGIPLNRWSEDGRFGSAHNTVADWITDHPQMPISAEAKVTLFQAADDYLASPTEENLARYILAIHDYTKPFDVERHFAGFDNSGTFMRFKFLAAQFAIHQMRMMLLHGDGYFENMPAPAMHPYSFSLRRTNGDLPSRNGLFFNDAWDVASTMRPLEGLMSFGSLVGQSPENDTYGQRQEHITQTWFWVGLLIDPGLKRTNGSNTTKTAEYQFERLRRFDLGAHAYFLAGIMTTFASFGENSFEMLNGSPKTFADRPSFTNLYVSIGSGDSGMYWQDLANGEIEGAAVQQRMMKNLARAWMYWMLDDLKQRKPFVGKASHKDIWRTNVDEAYDFLQGTDKFGRRNWGTLVPGDTHDDDALRAELLRLIDASPTVKDPVSTPSTNG